MKILLSVAALICSWMVSGGDLFPVDLSKGVRKYLPGEKQSEFHPWDGKCVSIPIDTGRSRYVEIAFEKKTKLPRFRKLRVSAVFQAEAGCPVRSIGLRLGDAKGEVFQYSRDLLFRKGEILEVNWDVSPADWKHSWGVRRDGKLDQPVSLSGFGVDYAKNTGKNTEIKLLSFRADVESDGSVRSERTFYSFDRNCRFFKKSGTAGIQESDGALILTGIRGRVAVTERRDSLIRLENLPFELILDAERIGSPVEISWVLRDGADKRIEIPPQPLLPGRRRMVFPLEPHLSSAGIPLRMESMILHSGPGPANVILRDCRLAFRCSPAEALTFDIQTGNEIGVLKSTEKTALAYRLKNTADAEGLFALNLQYTHYDGTVRKESIPPVLLKSGGETVVPASVLPDRFGHWDVKAEITELHSKKTSVRTAAFAFLEPAGPTPGRAPGFLFGVCTHFGRWAEADRKKEYLAAALCGAKVIRSSIEWGGLQPSSDRWNFRLMDEMVESCGAYGMELQAMFAFTPRWAASPERRSARNWLVWSRGRPDSNAWKQYVKTMTERYRGRIRYWEVWNEPDLSGFNKMRLEEYIQLQKLAWTAAKSTVPEAKIMSGGFATMSDHPGRKDKGFHRNYLSGAKGAFEIHAYHEHGSFQDYADRVDRRFLPMRRAAGTTVPWYANETAVASMHGSERNQAETLFKKLIFAWSRGAIGYSWYDLRNDGFDPSDCEHNYGMMTHDFQPKPVYSVFNMLAGRYRDMKFVRSRNPGKNLWLFEFTDGRDILLPFWDETGTGSTILAFRSDAKSASRIDLMGNEQTVPMKNGILILSPGAAPLTLCLRGASTVELLPIPIQMENPGVLVPDRPFSFTFVLSNPSDRIVTYEMNWESPSACFTEKSRCLKKTLSPGMSCKIPVSLATAPGRNRIPEFLSWNLSLPEFQWSGTVSVPVHPAVVIPRGNFEGRGPDFELKTADHVVSLTQADPALAHRIWKGPADHGAKLWLSEDSGDLRMRVEVADDVHHQPYSGFEVWKGDGIQFGLKADNQEGRWEIGLTRLNSGKSEGYVWMTPSNFISSRVASKIRLRTSRENGTTRYEMRIPLAELGLSKEVLSRGLRFNLLINDNDGEGRDGWLHIVPGLGENKNPDRWPFLLFDP